MVIKLGEDHIDVEADEDVAEDEVNKIKTVNSVTTTTGWLK